MNKDLSNLLQKQMDRRDFLKHVGIGFVAITGITTLVKTLNSVSTPTKGQTASYGASTYGGNRPSAKQ